MGPRGMQGKESAASANARASWHAARRLFVPARTNGPLSGQAYLAIISQPLITLLRMPSTTFQPVGAEPGWSIMSGPMVLSAL